MHDDFIETWPQSGERIRGRPSRRAILENYPGRAEQGLPKSVGRIIGTDDEFVPRVVGPGWGIVHLSGSGDEFQLTSTVRYPDGQTWHAVLLLTLRDAKIWRLTTFFAPPFDPAAWRSQYVEVDEPPGGSEE